VAGDIAQVAERLRLVRRARRKFLRLWAIDRHMIEPLVERVAQDLSKPDPARSAQHPRPPTVDES
jgi:hypothetical protein